MARFIGSRCVLAVRDLKASTDFYLDKLGFEREPIEAAGWSFLRRDEFHLMLGECTDERPARELGNHSYFVYLEVEGVDELCNQVRTRGVEVISELADKEWGMREFGVRTIDGHRIMFGEERPG